MKEYNIKCDYTSKHSSHFDKIVGQVRGDEIEHLKKSIKKQGVFLQERFRTGDKTDF